MNNNYGKYLTQWIKGIASEYRYWNNYFETHKDTEIFRARMSQHPDFTDMSIIDDSIRNCLDVGAGPISTLGNKLNDRELDLVAIDPLADLYNTILGNYGIQPYCRTQFGISECISDFFEKDYFDLVYIRNALDHSFWPINAILQMIYVTRLNHNVVLFHRINEAERRNYGGFHQWNITIEGKNILLWNKTEKININSTLSYITNIHFFEVKDGEYDAVKIIINKKRNMEKPITLTNEFCKIIFSFFCKFTLEREDFRKKLAKIS